MSDSNFLADPVTWYTIGLLAFVGITVKLGGKGILAGLDGEIAKIREGLNEAKKLRQEAEATLKDAEAKQKAAMQDAEMIIRQAKEEAAQLKAKAEADLVATLARQEQRALTRIQMAESSALAEVRQAIIDASMDATRQILSQNLDSQTATKLVDEALSEIPRLKTAQN